MKYIFVIGGVASGLGKGVTASSIGFILKHYGQRVRMRKFEPYLNMDSGTMNPFEHGEVYVTADGGETDLDLGTYERFVGVSTTRADAVTTGQIYSNVLMAERRGDYLGKTVQIIPHITDEICRNIVSMRGEADIGIIEIGGTVGDCESDPFVRAVQRFLCSEAGHGSIIVFVTLAPVVPPNELKTKPIQHAVEQLRAICRPPDIIICRAERELGGVEIQKISANCSIPASSIFPMPNCDSIYHVPMQMQMYGIDTQIVRMLGISQEFTPSEIIPRAFPRPRGDLDIAVVGKYVTHGDAYLSLRHAIILSAARQCRTAKIHWIEELTPDFIDYPNFDLDDAKIMGVVIPGGYGTRGIDAILRSIRICRERDLPLLGICLGMQLMCIDAFKEIYPNDPNGTSEEFDPTAPNPVVKRMQLGQSGQPMQPLQPSAMTDRLIEPPLGGTMRLGEHRVEITPGSKLANIYGAEARERFRHRYEINSDHAHTITSAGVNITGITDGHIACIEWQHHNFAIGVQFHPEFTATLEHTSPLFDSFTTACLTSEHINLSIV